MTAVVIDMEQCPANGASVAGRGVLTLLVAEIWVELMYTINYT